MNDTALNVTTPTCGIFNYLDCAEGEVDDEDRFLALLILALACAVCVLCVLVFVLAVLVQKMSTIWLVALAKTADVDSADSDRGLLHGIKSSFGPKGKQKRKTSFAEDTSCAAARDADEEEL